MPEHGGGRRLPRRERQDVRLAFGHTIRGYAKALLGDHYDATQQDLALGVVLQVGGCFHERENVLQCFARVADVRCSGVERMWLSGIRPDRRPNRETRRLAAIGRQPTDARDPRGRPAAEITLIPLNRDASP
jgi:hypothetical protein